MLSSQQASNKLSMCLSSAQLLCNCVPADQETSTWVHLPVAEGEKDEGADSGPVPTHLCRPDDYTIFTELSRPMPDYALEHVFAQHGPVEWVSLAQRRYPACIATS